ncbi:uncharacterized protein LOC107772114 [Nicotiana tabacum]|uniref:Uncharacterized protein LOC107772114 n=1 Tax=Nicotiana tabacum TaxID=4097 RepID=A0AC58TGX7_TOBAC
MEYLTRSLKNLKDQPNFNYHPRCERLGLVANLNKSNIYFGGVSSAVQQEITQKTGFSIGELPFRYLSVPLSTKKLSIFPLPKKIIQQVEVICTKFLWIGDSSSSKKTLAAWNKLYRPKTKGGLNATDLNTWNRVALLKHM